MCLTSLIKCVLALEFRIIPPNIKFGQPNPNIPFQSGKLAVPTDATPWPVARPGLISINSFGIGGSNVHAILESFEPQREKVLVGSNLHSYLLLHSARSADSLKAMIFNFDSHVHSNRDNLPDLSYTLANGREHMPYRSFTIAASDGSTSLTPVTKINTLAGHLVMAFTGQGAQWPQMGRELLRHNSTFRNSIRATDQYLESFTDSVPQWRLEDELCKPAQSTRLFEAEIAQPALTALQIALVDTLASVGIVPAAVIGHSGGEIAAAYAAGALTAKEAIRVSLSRGVLIKDQTRKGAMAAIGMGWEDTMGFLQPNVSIACDNSPSSVTISGDADQVQSVVANIRASRQNVLTKVLSVDKAYHSSHMNEFGENYVKLLKNSVLARPVQRPFFSSTMGKLINTGEILGLEYWKHNLVSPVMFHTAVTCVLKHPFGQNAIFLEVGPHSALAGPLRQIIAHNSSTATYVASMLREKNSVDSFLAAIGKLFTLNIAIDFRKLVPRGRLLPGLPPYPWNHPDSFWYESRVAREWRLRRYPCHDLLGIKLPESTDLEPVWRNILHLDNVPWLRDHVINGDIIFPFAGYIGLIGEAIRQAGNADDGYRLRRRGFFVFPALPRKVPSAKWYNAMSKDGLQFGHHFQSLESIRTSTTSNQSATANVRNNRQGDEKFYHLHPTIIDSALQLVSCAAIEGLSRKYRKLLPTVVESMSIIRSSHDVNVSVSAASAVGDSIVGDGVCLAENKPVLEMSGLGMSPLIDMEEPVHGDKHALARYTWGPHIDFMALQDLINPTLDRSTFTPLLNELAQLCVLHSSRRLAKLTTALPHMEKFRAWVEASAAKITSPILLAMDDASIGAQIIDVVHELEPTPGGCAALAMREIQISIEKLFVGEVHSLQVLKANDLLDKVYSFTEACDRSLFLRHLAHSKPNLRVLEIGAGTGATSKTILAHLILPNGQPLYSRYAFTDVSSDFLAAAKENMKDIPNMDFLPLDISRAPAEQGFDGQQFDLVIATNVLHATPNLGSTLKNVRNLIARNGRLLLHELCSTSKWVNYVFGILSGWWDGALDGRIDEPYIMPERWITELTAAGFKEPDAIIYDANLPFQTNAIIVAQPDHSYLPAKKLVLLCDSQKIEPQLLINSLSAKGFEVSRLNLGDQLPADQDVIAALDEPRPFFDGLDEQRFEQFKHLIGSLGTSRMMWLTRPCHLECQDPRYAQIMGVARTIRSETLVDFATCETEDIALDADIIAGVFLKFHLRENDDILGPDFEIAIHKGVVHVGRFVPFSLLKEISTTSTSKELKLEVAKGRLGSVHWCPKAAPVLRADEVDVVTCAAGMNFLVRYGITSLI